MKSIPQPLSAVEKFLSEISLHSHGYQEITFCYLAIRKNSQSKPNSTLRAQHRAAHLAFVATCRAVFLYGGLLLDEAGKVAGSLMVLDLPDRAALDAHMARDPYFVQGIFASVEIFESRQIVPEVTPGSLEAELAKQRAAQAAQ